MDDAPIEGFGTEMFELWNENDRSEIIFEEAGYDMTSGVWEYDC